MRLVSWLVSLGIAGCRWSSEAVISSSFLQHLLLHQLLRYFRTITRMIMMLSKMTTPDSTVASAIMTVTGSAIVTGLPLGRGKEDIDEVGVMVLRGGVEL